MAVKSSNDILALYDFTELGGVLGPLLGQLRGFFHPLADARGELTATPWDKLCAHALRHNVHQTEQQVVLDALV